MCKDQVGNLSVERDPNSFIWALAKIMALYPDIRFEFNLIGKMPDKIMVLVKQLGMSDCVTFALDLPYQDCLQQMENADALLLIEASVENGIFFPSKISDYVEVGRPILMISPREGVMRDLHDSYGVGYFAEADDPESVVAALDRLVSDWINDRITNAGMAYLRSQSCPSNVVEHIARLAWPND